MDSRPYQTEIHNAVVDGFKTYGKQLIVVPTGGGKTIVFAKLVEHFARCGAKSLILAHREELVDQAIAKLRAATGIIAGKEKAESVASKLDTAVVASIQTMQRRLDRWPQDHFGFVVCDEAHHAISDSWQSVLKHFDGHAKILGVTATPDRGDKKNLGSYFENIAAEISLFDLIRDGYLSRITVKSVPLEIDVRGVKQSAGDYDSNALGDALTPYLRRIAEAIRDHAPFRRVLVFLPLIATSKAFVEIAQSVGLDFRHVDGMSDDRKELLAGFDGGEFDGLSNAMLLTEGYDSPGIDCVCVLRPTRSRALYSQMVGRGTRVAPHKRDLLLLDFLWMHEKHNLVHPASLISDCEETAKIITELSQKAGGSGQDELDLEGLATSAQAEREKRLREELEKNQKRKSKFLSAEEFALNNHVVDLANWEPSMAWERGPISEKQAGYLKRAGIDVATVRGAGHASKLLNIHFAKIDKAPATDKVKAIMRRMGRADWATATTGQGRRFMASLARR